MTFLLRSVTICDFGPYQGEHHVSFGDGGGVWIIYGRNGRGKTHLHNALRFALYGEIQGRTGPIAPEAAANEITREANGAASFRVDLSFSIDDDSFVLRRGFNQKSDLAHYLSLEVNGKVLSRAHAEAETLRLFPPSLRQFFLLDAEDLRPYENLTEEESEEGERLRASIEQLLGIPYLRAAAADAEALHADARKQVTAQARAHEATAKHADALSTAQAIKDGLDQQLKSEMETLEERRRKLAGVERQLADNEAASRAFADRESAKVRRDEAQAAFEGAVASLQEILPTTWRAVLAPFAHRHRERLQSRVVALQTDLSEAADAARTLEHLSQGEMCPTCGAEMNAQKKATIKEAASETLERIGAPEGIMSGLADLQRSVQVLTGVIERGERPLLIERDDAVSSSIVRLEREQARIDEAEEVLQRLEAVDVKSLNQDRDNLTLQVTRLLERIENLRKEIDAQANQIEKLRKSIRDSGFVADPSVERLESLSRDIALALNRSADEYRDDLKTTVEERASEIFRSLSTEADYASLEINDYFGLRILNAEGGQVPGRSAGYEHLVALSLIAALQGTAPVSGPVVMDNPFLRLDSDHTDRVVAALPRVADQVILLTFPGEFDREVAIDALGDSLAGEMRLVRISSRSTAIERGGPDGR